MTEFNIETSLTNLRAFFEKNQTKELTFRKKQLLLLKESLIKYEETVYNAFEKDLHKGKFETYCTEFGFVLSTIDTMIKYMDEWLKPKSVKLSKNSFYAKTKIYKEPFGVVYIMGPFNYPLQLIMVPLIGALASGNCAVVRPSKRTPNVANVIGDIITDAFSQDYVVFIDPLIVPNKDVLEHQFDFIFFTGSAPVGKIILQAAAQFLTPCVLELGGKSPAIVASDANIELTAQQIVWSKFINNGQTCISTDYCLVSREIEDVLIEEIKRQIIAFYGTDILHSTDYGRLVDKKAVDRLIKMITDNQESLIYGGKYEEDQLYIEPTLFKLPLDRNNDLMKEELFGPLLPILAFDDFCDAISFIKKGDKPLAAYLFSDDNGNQKRFIEELSFGGGCVNQTILQFSNDYSPFGGVGESGMGNYHGEYSINTFTHEKTIVFNRRLSQKFGELVLPPYTKKKWKLLKDILK